MAAIEGLPETDLHAPGVIAEGWLVKDLMAHIAAWEAECVTALAQSRQGRRPAILDIQDVDDWNARRYAENKDRGYERIRADFDGARRQMIRQVENLAEADFSDPARFPWLGGRSLADFIGEESFGHEREHTAQIKAWREKLHGAQ